MNATRLAQIVERQAIHQAVCRARRQGLCCSTCSDFAESAERAKRRLAQLVKAVA